ncbi:MAG: membrane protein insertase YidC [Myxococcales bacterium]|nr:membrane protein insertase YidC [Myxococcales bacterium]
MKDMNQRLFLAIAIWLACIFGYYTWFAPKKAAQPVAGQTSAAQESPKPAVEPPVAAAPATPAPVAPKAADVPRGTKPEPPLREVTFETPRARIVATSQGAAIKSIQLLGDKWTRHKGAKDESHLDLVGEHAGEPFPFATVVKGTGGAEILPANEPYELVRQDATSATFRAERGGVTLTKTLSVNPANYGINLAVEVRSATPLSGHLWVQAGVHAQEPSGGMFSSRTNTPSQAICLEPNKSKPERLAIGAKHPEFDAQGAQFAGIDEQYFLTAVLPPAGVSASCRLETHGEKTGSLIASLVVPVQGTAAQLSFKGYGGPKDDPDLVAVAEALKHSIDFGFWSVIAELLLTIMKFFQRIVPGHNWGIAIILLTVAMKLLTFPLQHKSMKSMQEMQRIQPQLDELKKKYAGDSQRQNLEQMKLFKEHGVNPMGSCLPMLIQMPIWFALYTTLQVSVELYNAPFIPGWLDDLTAKDPYYVLPVAMGITMILTQVLTPTPMSNPSQKTMGYVMSGFFSLLMLTLPSGLTLYIFTNNVLSIGQQMYLRRALPAPPAKGQTIEVKPGSGSGEGRAKLRA